MHRILAYLKWSEGFKCLKCGHTGSQIRVNSSRTFNKCSHTESATANTYMYSMKIDNYSAKELEKIFEKHISEEATVITDKWKGYRPLMKQYDITQVESELGMNFKALHTMIHQVKSWIRTTYS